MSKRCSHCVIGLYCIRCYVEHGTRLFLWGHLAGFALGAIVMWAVTR